MCYYGGAGGNRPNNAERNMYSETYDDNHPITIARSSFSYFNDQKESLVRLCGSFECAVQEIYDNLGQTIWEMYGKQRIEWDGMSVDPQDLADAEWKRLWIEQEGEEFYEKHVF